MMNWINWQTGNPGFILQILFVALLIAIIVWLLRYNFQNRDALEIVNRRYARGDISRKQYEQLRKDIIRKNKERNR